MGRSTRARVRVLPLVPALVLALVATVLALALGTVGATAVPPPDLPPVLGQRGFADPAVVRANGGYVALSTGRLVPRAVATDPRGPWTSTETALLELPVWATGPEIWAADAVRIGGRWLLYYSVPVGGLGEDGRCIGVAASTTVTGTFTPIGSRPLVCPRKALAPQAWDFVPRWQQGLPISGVIDPSGFRDRDGRRYLVYRTQSFPSSIRMVRLASGGARTAQQERSEELLRDDGTVENPVIVRRDRHYVLFASEGDYRGCRYRTTWRRSTDLHDFSAAKRHLLLKRSLTGVCGPGGADVVELPGERTELFFHGWTCPELGGHCPADFWLERDLVLKPRRAMYAAELAWSETDSPSVAQFLTPPVPAA